MAATQSAANALRYSARASSAVYFFPFSYSPYCIINKTSVGHAGSDSISDIIKGKLKSRYSVEFKIGDDRPR